MGAIGGPAKPVLSVLSVLFILSSFAGDWAPAKGPLMTRWAAQVDPGNCLPEYPRPQMVRSNWLNLNGLWDYAVRPLDWPQPQAYDGKILVPFPIESALSGVMKPCDEKSALWYRTTVEVPGAWRQSRVRLLCGAIDWECRLLVNGHEVGRHSGGYSRFAFDITDLLRWSSPEEVVLRVIDPTEGEQPRGKQTRTPEGIFYSANSGIWQTIWLEPVPAVSIDDLSLTPDVDAGGLRIRVAVNSLADDLTVEASACEGSPRPSDGRGGGGDSSDAKPHFRVSGNPNCDLFLAIPQPKLWSPDEPFLYDLSVTLRQGNRVVDQVESYFAMRKVSLLADQAGVTRIALNNKAIFQIGVLDQGFWPDGIYTAATDEALKSDIVFLKNAGFNLARKHVKVEPDRWYYWCDRLGLLVWQDMPSGKNVSAESRRSFEVELLRMLRDLHNHPSIIAWVVFNEGWGQYDTERLCQWIKAIDPSRLVDNASGWTDRHVGDIVDLHSYPGPDSPEPEPRRAAVLGEFGGLGLPLEGHCWSSNRWAYKMAADAGELASAYAHLLERVWTLHDRKGLSAAVYTQLADVETECTGLLTYEREKTKLSASFLFEANHTSRRVPLARTVVADASQEPAIWSYTFTKPSPDWMQPGFEPSGPWKSGSSGFGTLGTPGSRIGTPWDSSDIWLRRSFVLREEDLSDLKLVVHHDEEAELYLNGVLACKLTGFTTRYELADILPPAASTLRTGTNILAVHCHQTTGGQYIDVGLVALRPAFPQTNTPYSNSRPR